MRMLSKISFQLDKFEFINKIIANKYEENVVTISTLLEELNFPFPDMEARLIISTLDGIMFDSLIMKDVIRVDELEKHLIFKYCKKVENQ